ncbi:MAG: indole-3-glycerol phosphate synthase TrpC [Muribaculum sp.]|nr:indole-3-glycerol phosphate synthase TrpC [Muribaculaceae bacterium]MCM1081444.1 indole-3-glycerol phosphate synthase TrpC [Muribaculum sp.]
MGNILDRIIASKRREVEALRLTVPERLLTEMALATKRATVSMKQSIVEGTGVIAEFKRRSPSKGEIAPFCDVTAQVAAYESAGASACSVLTDAPFFGGSVDDLVVARYATHLPIIRKDFIIDSVQIAVARIAGADAVLLIASALSRNEIEQLSDFAHLLGLEVLLELHDIDECAKIVGAPDMIGINNRNLHTFSTSVSHALSFVDRLPAEAVKIAESGISAPSDVISLRRSGFNGFLIGEALMKSNNLKEFFDEIQS